ncbi:MAG TPA: hypothetical protein VGR10_08165 [Thermoleophilaceae bacterium]|nr:hypothetical protein [Thermoleophilaceae bacterium]
MPPLAHAADFISLLMFVPALVFVGWLAVQRFRERGEARGED